MNMKLIQKTDRIEKYVCEDGNIVVITKGGKIKISKGGKSKNGYYITGTNEGFKYVHRLVFENFVCKIPKGFEINHVDGDRANNSIVNLEIVTRQQNLSDPIRRKRLSNTFKNNPAHSKQAVMIYKNEVIIKQSGDELAKYMSENYGLPFRSIKTCWFRVGIPQIHRNNVQFIGYVDSDEWKEYCRLNNIDLEKIA